MSTVIIEGITYDITKWKDFHPGGRAILNFYNGADATDAFREFHACNPAALKKLESLKKVEGKPLNEEALLKDFRQLRKELEQEGHFDPSYGHVFYRVIEAILFHVIGWWLVTVQWPYLGCIFWAFGNLRVAWLMHEGGHNSLTRNAKVDKLIQLIFFSLSNGGSSTFWNNQHNKHHAATQRINFDVDLNTLPLVVFNMSTLKKSSKPLGWMNKLWLKYQAYLFTPIITCMVVLFWEVYSHPRHMIRTRQKLELFFYTLHWIFIFTHFNFPQFLVIKSFVSFCLFLNFALSHSHKPVSLDNEEVNWVEFSANHTMNIHPSWWCDWWMGYLNYQIEHHLFPSMPQFKNKQISGKIKQLFEKHGLVYDSKSYWEGIRITYKNLNDVGLESYEFTFKKEDEKVEES